ATPRARLPAGVGALRGQWGRSSLFGSTMSRTPDHHGAAAASLPNIFAAALPAPPTAAAWRGVFDEASACDGERLAPTASRFRPLGRFVRGDAWTVLAVFAVAFAVAHAPGLAARPD